jgi:hypothetical protein
MHANPSTAQPCAPITEEADSIQGRNSDSHNKEQLIQKINDAPDSALPSILVGGESAGVEA